MATIRSSSVLLFSRFDYKSLSSSSLYLYHRNTTKNFCCTQRFLASSTSDIATNNNNKLELSKSTKYSKVIIFLYTT
ncbi:hypothetical protein PVAND_007302 [Polypedilum vanderplanki]|uniref:Uncharacterized protein n=1 Tax=Polypedilum vanderplanki TaxID=319348 RepID=A0A9J6C6F0_POLVA|nr:hypothetical protein PVAND_007302 [Polypedilum vanderplanki]